MPDKFIANSGIVTSEEHVQSLCQKNLWQRDLFLHAECFMHPVPGVIPVLKRGLITHAYMQCLMNYLRMRC